MSFVRPCPKSLAAALEPSESNPVFRRDLAACFQAEEDPTNWPYSEGLLDATDPDTTDYAPSIATDFSGFLPDASTDDALELDDSYNPDAILQSAWKSLQSKEPEMVWSGDFWDQFLDPKVSAFSMMQQSYKRPMPVPVHSEPASSTDMEVSRRVVPRTDFCSTYVMYQNVAGKRNVKLFGK